MKKLMALACAVALTSGAVRAADACPPSPCPQPEKWVEVCETIQVPVQVTEYVEEPCEVKVTRMVPCETDVETCVGKWTFETKTIQAMKLVVECEEFVVDEIRYETRPETRTRQVSKVVCENVEKTVVDKVGEDICDPVTGKVRKVWKEVPRVVIVPEKKKICVDEEYTVNVKCKVTVPVAKTRQVRKQVPIAKEVRTPKYVKETVMKKVTVMKPVVETRIVMKKKAVRTTKMVEKQVVKKVKVPRETGC